MTPGGLRAETAVFRIISVSISVVICGVLFAGTIAAQTSAPKDRPRIGLVLSGGGARGLAHVGVIAVLEEMQIPVDYVAGTSMGAIVGGFYAAGLSPADMEKLVTSMEWNEAFKDKPPPWFCSAQQ